MSMQANAFGKAEFDDWIYGRAAPMGLFLWIRTVVPEGWRVTEGRFEAWLSFDEFERLPIERDGCGIEECAVKITVFCVAFVCSKLVEIKDMRTEDER